MARKGRPSKSGKRQPNGDRKTPDPSMPRDKGSEWVQARKARFGEHQVGALDRAFAAGFLGDDDTGKDRFDTAGKFSRLYGRVIRQGRYRCALNDDPRGGGLALPDHDGDARDQEWIKWAMAEIDKTGCRPFFDQLVSELYMDAGPYWLDNMLAVEAWNDALPSLNAERKHEGELPLQRKINHRGDIAVMDAAIKAIDAIVQKRPRAANIAA